MCNGVFCHSGWSCYLPAVQGPSGNSFLLPSGGPVEGHSSLLGSCSGSASAEADETDVPPPEEPTVVTTSKHGLWQYSRKCPWCFAAFVRAVGKMYSCDCCDVLLCFSRRQQRRGHLYRRKSLRVLLHRTPLRLSAV